MDPKETEALDRFYSQELAKRNAQLIFNDLFSFASDICLDYTPAFEHTTPLNPERIVINSFGTRGLRTALEMRSPRNKLSTFMLPSTSSEDDEKDYITLETPLREPRLFSTELDASIQDKITAFGEALIDESYKSLGEDVEEKITALTNATNVVEQEKVIDWLDDRLTTIVRRSDNEAPDDTENEFAYQPYRLSPKVIGVYPAMNERPTCLGVSIIATSFFKKAGMETLHAGVNMSGDEMTVFTGFNFVSTTTSTAHALFEQELAPPAKKAVDNTVLNMHKSMTQNAPQHAAVFTRLIDGSWMQFDPNYVATNRIQKGDMTDVLDNTLQELDALSAVAPGTEISVLTDDDTIFPLSFVSQIMMSALSKEQFATLRATATSTLETMSDEAILETLYQECILPFFKPENASEEQGVYLGLVSLTTPIKNTERSETMIRAAFDTTLRKYVMWDEMPETFLNKIRTDTSYRQNRIDDITNLPILMMIAMVKAEAEEFTPWYSHFMLDIGKPEYRIGATVLSDFALYYDFPLPPSFWMSYWPGNAGVVEHLVGDMDLKSDRAMSLNNAAYHHLHPFTSFKNNGIIKSFLNTDPQGE
jgi:hypothetical protein